MAGTKLTKSLLDFLKLSGGAMTGAITTNSTFDGVDIATRDGVLTSTTTTADAALPKAGGTMTGNIILPVQTSHPTGSGTEGEIVISKTVGARATYRISVYIDGVWKYEQLT